MLRAGEPRPGPRAAEYTPSPAVLPRLKHTPTQISPAWHCIYSPNSSRSGYIPTQFPPAWVYTHPNLPGLGIYPFTSIVLPGLAVHVDAAPRRKRHVRALRRHCARQTSQLQTRDGRAGATLCRQHQLVLGPGGAWAKAGARRAAGPGGTQRELPSLPPPRGSGTGVHRLRRPRPYKGPCVGEQTHTGTCTRGRPARSACRALAPPAACRGERGVCPSPSP